MKLNTKYEIPSTKQYLAAKPQITRLIMNDPKEFAVKLQNDKNSKQKCQRQRGEGRN